MYFFFLIHYILISITSSAQKLCELQIRVAAIMKTNCDSDEAETHLALIKESSKMLLERAVWLPRS